VLRFILRRLGLGLITLWVLSLLIFFGTHILPGNPGRAMLGPFASDAAVQALNDQLGANDPLLKQYTTWIGDVLHGDLGTSYAFKQPVGDLIRAAMENSLKLAVLAFVIVVPLSILGGVFAALHVGRPADRIISIGGLSVASMPEFVGGIVLILVFGLWLNVLPVSASWPPGTPPLQQIQYLLMPALSLVLVLFGYIARMARAGTVTALDSDYARTATLKGLPRRTVVRRHVLRNALLPTITVIATQVGYLIGGLVVVEQLFNYNGIGTLLLNAARNRDYPQLQSTVLVIGVIYLVATLVADVLYSVLNPRIRYGGTPE
jgi:peptide/nickel transport system permease protein